MKFTKKSLVIQSVDSPKKELVDLLKQHLSVVCLELRKEDGKEGYIVYRDHISPTFQLIFVLNPDPAEEG